MGRCVNYRVDCVRQTVYRAKILAGAPVADGSEILEIRFFSYTETKEIHTAAWLPIVLEDIFENKRLR